MTNYPKKIIQLITTTFVLALLFSCSQDNDLLTDLVLEDAIGNEITEASIDSDSAAVRVSEDKAISFNMLNNKAGKGGKRRFKSAKQPMNGGLVIQKDSIAIYTPDHDFNGKDVLEITLEINNDDNTTSDILMNVDVTVDPIKDVVDDKVETEAGTKLLIEPLENDTFKQESGVQITKTSTSSKGAITINDDNTLTYTPNAGASGIDLFTYTTEIKNMDDTLTTETGNITVTINGSGTASTSSGDMGPLKAFPGAEGFGKSATGGRGGAVIEVTNLNDSGSGSLRAALTAKGARTIVFKVSGNINLNSYLFIGSENGNVTIAGQTAPRGGITIKNHGIRIEGSNTIVRYIRFRPGDAADSREDAVTIVARSGRTTQDIILDHCSISWGKDENFNIGAIGGVAVKNVTLQNSIIAENIGTGYGVLLWNNANNISFYQNLLAHNAVRNIRSSTCSSDFEFINNVVYSFKSAMAPTYENKFDIIGNVFISNPNVTVSQQIVKLEASANNCPNSNVSLSQAYISDNTYDGGNISIETQLNAYSKSSRIFNSGITPKSSGQTKEIILANSGANLYRDSSDNGIISDVSNRTGNIPKSVSQAGGYPNLPNGTSYADSDKDGMSNSWESANGLNPNDASDGKKDRDGDGYTNLEEYLHYLTIQ